MELIFDGIEGKDSYFKNCCSQGAELQFNALKIKFLNLTPKEDCLLMFNNFCAVQTVLLIGEITNVS